MSEAAKAPQIMPKVANLSDSVNQNLLSSQETHQTLHALVSDEMQHVLQLINERMRSDEQTIPDISNHIMRASGKHMRPMLTLASAHLCGYQGRDHITLATAIELMHTATLLHDDVVDESDKRRGQETSRLKWGNAASVLVGDFMLGQAFKLMVSIGNLEALSVLSHASTVIAKGEVMQLATISKIDITQDYYLKVIDFKTASLFAAATEIGASIAKQDKTFCDALSEYGRNLGIAFQLVDDALDYGNPQITGKNVGDDFRESKVTLPVSLAYHAGTPTEREFWERTIIRREQTDGDLEKAQNIIQTHNGLQLTIERAREFGEKAKDALAIFPDNPYRHAMLDVVAFCIRRNF